MKNIFIGNLNFSTSEGALRLMMDSDTGKPRGFGFVEMASVEDGDKGIAALNGTLLDERALNVNEARPRKQLGSFRDHARTRAVADCAGSSPLHPVCERGGRQQGYCRTQWDATPRGRTLNVNEARPRGAPCGTGLPKMRISRARVSTPRQRISGNPIVIKGEVSGSENVYCMRLRR